MRKPAWKGASAPCRRLGRWSLLLVLGASVAASDAGPIGGGMQTEVKISAGGDVELPAGGGPDFPKQITFAKGQRACVIVTGLDIDHDTDLLKLEVVDQATGAVVARDEGAYNLVAIWYPRRDMTCTIRVSNDSREEHRVYISVK